MAFFVRSLGKIIGGLALQATPEDNDRIQFSFLATAADLCLCAARIRLRNR